MGRYCSGDFEYKFMFGKQDSNFGEIMDDITRSELNTGEIGYSNRFIGDGGEYVDIYVENAEEFKHLIQQYIDEDGIDFLSEWDKEMLQKFSERLDTVDGCEMLQVYVEY